MGIYFKGAGDGAHLPLRHSPKGVPSRVQDLVEEDEERQRLSLGRPLEEVVVHAVSSHHQGGQRVEEGAE